MRIAPPAVNHRSVAACNFLNYSANKQTEVKTLPLPSCGVGNKNVHVRDTGKGLIHIETHLCRYTLKIENDNIDNN